MCPLATNERSTRSAPAASISSGFTWRDHDCAAEKAVSAGRSIICAGLSRPENGGRPARSEDISFF
jgi:hypothetical protein